MASFDEDLDCWKLFSKGTAAKRRPSQSQNADQCCQTTLTEERGGWPARLVSGQTLAKHKKHGGIAEVTERSDAAGVH